MEVGGSAAGKGRSMRRFVLVGVLGSVLALSSSPGGAVTPPPAAAPAHAAASAPAPSAAPSPGLRLVRAIGVVPLVEAGLDRAFAPGEPRLLASSLLAKDAAFLAAYELEIAGLYERRFSADELRRLADFYEGDLGKKWAGQQLGVEKDQQALWDAGKGTVATLREIGCTTSFMVDVIDTAKATAKVTDPGIPANLQPLVDSMAVPARRFCACVTREFEKKYGPGGFSRQVQAESDRFVEQLVSSGTCPAPSAPETKEAPAQP